MKSTRIAIPPVQKSLVIATSSFAQIGGLATISGWIFNVPRLTDWADDGISMFANPALCAVLLGISIQILMSTKNIQAIWLTRILSISVAIIALFTFVEHLTGLNFGIDTFLVAREWGQNASLSSMRMGIPACISFFLLSSALTLTSCGSRQRKLASLIVLPVLAIVSVSLIGYWFGANLLYGIASVTAIARQTAIVVFVLAIGEIALIPEYGFQRVLDRNDAGGLVLRRLVVPAVAIPLFLNGLRISAESAGYFDDAFGTAFITIIEVSLFALLLYLTASKVSRQALRISEIEKRLESVLATGEVGTWEFDIQSGIVTADKNLLKLFEMNLDHRTQHPIQEFLECVHSEDRNRVQEVVDRALTLGGHYEVEFPLKTGKWILARGRVERDPFGNPAFMQGVFFDVTQRKRTEEQIVQANKNKDEFLATLAHELRNPLSPIASSLLLLRDMPHESIEAKQLTDIADRHVKQLIRLVDDLLDVSRISRGKVVLQKSICRLQDVIDQAVESIQEVVRGSEHSLEVALPNESVYVNGDSTRLTQVVTNILSNAAKYTPNGGKISLALRTQNEFAVIEVVDNGIGIAPESLGKVFGLFTQLNDRDTTGKGGLGVGLALVKQLVELHDGQSTVLSDGEGCGTRVLVEIPMESVSTLEADILSESESALQLPGRVKRRVLVVDDMRANTFTLSRVLERMGHEVQSANSGPRALEIASLFRPHVVISDVSMPGMNGYELAKEIRQRWGHAIQLVAMTGYGAQTDRDESLRTGFDFHMVKPPDVRVLTSYFESIAELTIE